MKLKMIERMDGDSTHSFPIDGRSGEEAKLAKSHGYIELTRFKAQGANLRTDGLFCASCKAWRNKEFTIPENSSTHDGWCSKYHFRTRDYGCCNGWIKKTGLFSHNPS